MDSRPFEPLHSGPLSIVDAFCSLLQVPSIEWFTWQFSDSNFQMERTQYENDTYITINKPNAQYSSKQW